MRMSAPSGILKGGMGWESSCDDRSTHWQAPPFPSRFHYIFRKPIVTDPSMAASREACDGLYVHVKEEVEEGLAYLLKKRVNDPYSDLVTRLLYEAPSGWKKQAPTFTP